MEIEQFFICPHCWQNVSVIIDLSIEEQQYIEDCEVCCNPFQIRYTADGGEIKSFAAENIEQ